MFLPPLPRILQIELQWADIAAVRVELRRGQPGRLELTPARPPALYREEEPQPRKHVVWRPIPDFTGGPAAACAPHVLVFAPGLLDRHYEKLLACDARLRDVTTLAGDAVMPSYLATYGAAAAGAPAGAVPASLVAHGGIDGVSRAVGARFERPPPADPGGRPALRRQLRSQAVSPRLRHRA